MSLNDIRVYFDGCKLEDVQNDIRSTLVRSNLASENRVTFVGITSTKDSLAIFLPKGFSSENHLNSKRREAKTILDLLVKYQASHKYDQRLFGQQNEQIVVNVEMLNVLSNYRTLLDYYTARGIYRRRESVNDSSGRGRINWARTIKKETPILAGDQTPIYANYSTKRSIKQEVTSIVAIQKYYTALADLKIGWVFSESNEEIMFPELFASIEKPPGTKAYMLHQLLKERSRVFDVERLRLLDTLISIIENKESLSEDTQVVGVKYFWPIWEDILKYSFGDQSKEIINKLPVPEYQYTNKTRQASNTLIPDIVVFDSENVILFDAKYYDVEVTLPSWYDIVKQSFYKSTIYKLTGKNIAINSFVFPGEQTDKKPNSILIKDVDSNSLFDSSLYPSIKCTYYSVNKAINNYLHGTADKDYIDILLTE